MADPFVVLTAWLQSMSHHIMIHILRGCFNIDGHDLGTDQNRETFISVERNPTNGTMQPHTLTMRLHKICTIEESESFFSFSQIRLVDIGRSYSLSTDGICNQ